MKNLTVKNLVVTALLLALVVVVQQLRWLHPQLVAGPLVNAILIVAAVWVGLYSGLAIAILSPVFAFVFPPSPPLIQIMPVIMIGNAALVACAYFLKNKNLAFGLLSGAVLKAVLLWLGVVHLVIPVFGSGLPEPAVTALSAMFSYNQFITAVIGSVIVLSLKTRLDKSIGKSK